MSSTNLARFSFVSAGLFSHREAAENYLTKKRQYQLSRKIQKMSLQQCRINLKVNQFVETLQARLSLLSYKRMERIRKEIKSRKEINYCAGQ